MKPKNLKMKQLKFKPDKAKIDYILAKLSEKASSDCPAEEAGNPKVAKPHTEAKNHELASKQNEFEFLKKQAEERLSPLKVKILLDEAKRQGAIEVCSAINGVARFLKRKRGETDGR